MPTYQMQLLSATQDEFERHLERLLGSRARPNWATDDVLQVDPEARDLRVSLPADTDASEAFSMAMRWCRSERDPDWDYRRFGPVPAHRLISG